MKTSYRIRIGSYRAKNASYRMRNASFLIILDTYCIVLKSIVSYENRIVLYKAYKEQQGPGDFISSIVFHKYQNDKFDEKTCFTEIYFQLEQE